MHEAAHFSCQTTKKHPRCPFLNTALSDVEVELKSIEKPTRILLPGSMTSVEFGVIYRIRYEVVARQYWQPGDTNGNLFLGCGSPWNIPRS